MNQHQKSIMAATTGLVNRPGPLNS
jgi:hypothetical protein